MDYVSRQQDKFYLADAVKKVNKKLSPRWIAGVQPRFDGTVQELSYKVPKLQLYVIIRRYQEPAVGLWPDYSIIGRSRPIEPVPEPDDLELIDDELGTMHTRMRARTNTTPSPTPNTTANATTRGRKRGRSYIAVSEGVAPRRSQRRRRA
jgi:hypothetical protein